MPSFAALRHAPWSLSKVKCALRCPREFHYRYVDQIPEPEVASDARLGKAVHAALEAVIRLEPMEKALAAARTELLHDEERTRFDELAAAVRAFGERIAAFRQRRRVRQEMIEHKVAVNAELAPTSFIAKDAFFRGVFDAAFVFDDGVLAVVDHKTGVRRETTDHAEQLEGYATLAAAHLGPQVRKVWMGVHYVAEAAMAWSEPVPVDAVRAEFAPRLVGRIEQAAAAVANGPEPHPGGFCERCSYRAICPARRAGASDGGGDGDAGDGGGASAGGGGGGGD